MTDSPHRIEHDTLGAVQVPRDALYGSRTARCLATTSYSGRYLYDYPDLVHGFALVKRTTALANTAAGVLSPSIGQAIDSAALRLAAPEVLPALVADPLAGGGSISLHINVNEVLANLANESLGGRRGVYDPVDPFRHVGASQSTADVCHTAIRLAVLATADDLLPILDSVVDELAAVADRFAAVPTLARTCLRDGLPTTADVLFRGHAELFARRRDRLRDRLQPLYAVALGGTVIGDGSGAPAAYRERVVADLAQISAKPFTARHCLPDALQNSDDLGELSAALAGLARAAIKLAQDLRLLGSGPRGGFGELILPAVQEGSSFFAGKSNPVVPETLLQASFQILGCDHAAQQAVQAAELHLNVFDMQVGINVIDASQLGAAAFAALNKHCLSELDLDAKRCLELAAAATPTRGSRE